MSGAGKPPMLPPGRARRWWALVTALILSGGCGVLYVLQWTAGLRGHVLLEFFTFYLALPLAAAVLLLFIYFYDPAAK